MIFCYTPARIGAAPRLPGRRDKGLRTGGAGPGGRVGREGDAGWKTAGTPSCLQERNK